MDLDKSKFKSNFLEKKKQEKKKQQQNTKLKTSCILLSKVVKSFLTRAKLQRQAYLQHNSRMLVFIKNTQNIENVAEIQQYIFQFGTQELTKDRFNQFRSILYASLRDPRLLESSIQVINKYSIELQNIVRQKNFMKQFSLLLAKRKGTRILELSIKELWKVQAINNFNCEHLFDLLIRQSSQNYLDIEQSGECLLSIDTVCLLCAHFYKTRFEKLVQKDNYFFILNRILNSLSTKEFKEHHEYTIVFLLEQLLVSMNKSLQKIIKEQIQVNKNLIQLIEDEQQIAYLQNKIRQHQTFDEYVNSSIQSISEIFKNQILSELFKKPQCDLLRKTIINLVKELKFLFEGKNLFFAKDILSSDQTLLTLLKERKEPFYQTLAMKILPMDDQQFLHCQLFTKQNWKDVISGGMELALQIIKKIVIQNEKPIKLQLFARKNDLSMFLNSLSELMANLHLKFLRTKKYPVEWFILEILNNNFHTFSFGKGAKAIELMLKNFPFAFTFEHRYKKFREFIDQDKKNHDRALFLYEDVPEELIIQVRRGHQFMDAFHVCMNRDLRKKYKIVFFNEQGLQQQGIDGGGIIKEFINRVLKVSFSQLYNLFHETPQNQLYPNPNSSKKQEYDFIGRIIGKAVYQGITIQPKFAEPFLNLILGRKNSFEDIQYLDKNIYKSLLQLKHMGSQVSQLLQTFTILDQQKDGTNKYVNLLAPSKPPTKEVFVTEKNKMLFILAYTNYKCNYQLEQKAHYFRRGFLKVIKRDWLTMFSNQELNLIISGNTSDFSVDQLKVSTVYTDYHQKHPTIVLFWEVLHQFSAQQKSLFLLYVTSSSRPPTLGFSKLKPNFCIAHGGQNTIKLPTANTCMNVLRLPAYKTKKVLKQKLLYAINSKAGFQFA